MVNSCAVCGCCTRTDIVREHLEDTLRICDVSAKGLFPGSTEKLNVIVSLCHVSISTSLRGIFFKFVYLR